MKLLATVVCFTTLLAPAAADNCAIDTYSGGRCTGASLGLVAQNGQGIGRCVSTNNGHCALVGGVVRNGGACFGRFWESHDCSGNFINRALACREGERLENVSFNSARVYCFG